ncbi:hypothetical protein BM534_16350, partial [Clostridioides difficile]
ITDDWRVMIDQLGHPLLLMSDEINYGKVAIFHCYRPKYCLLITKSTTVYTVVLLLIIHEYTKKYNK